MSSTNAGLEVQAANLYIAGMTQKQIQYTLRKVPPQIDRELRKRARKEQRSLNEIALEALKQGLGLAGQPVRYHDLDALAGTWVHDPAFDRAIEAMDQVDPALWK